MRKVRFAVVGVRNFAAQHIKRIKVLVNEGLADLAGVVVRNQQIEDPLFEQLKQEGVRIYSSLDELLVAGQGLVDIITLPTSIHTHSELAAKCMKAGFNVVLEKPPVPTVQQVDELIRVEQETKRFCSLGFQFIHSNSIRQLKNLIVQGKLGSIIEISCKGYWPRDKQYYQRNPWAGRVIKDGYVLLDGPMHNALAHFLNNMLYLSSSQPQDSGKLKTVRAELYRANPYIQSDDTSCLLGETVDGTKIYFYVTHCSQNRVDPYMEIVGTKGKAIWKFNETTIVQLDDGEEIKFGNGGMRSLGRGYAGSCPGYLGELEKPYSSLENSRSFVVAINGAYLSSEKIRPIPEEYVSEHPTESRFVVKDIDNLLDQAFAQRKLLSELRSSLDCVY